MKNILYIGFLLLNSNLLLGQQIDDLNTNKKVANFLVREINKEYTFKEVFDEEKEEDTEDFEYFVKKIDLDNNGYTDLVVNAYLPLIIILNYENKSYKELNFRNTNYFSDFQPELDSIVTKDIEKILILETEIHEFDNKEYSNIRTKKDQETLTYNSQTKKNKWVIRDVNFKVDSLIVQFGELVHYKQKKAKASKIKELQFSTSGCFGTCPVFEIKLTSDRNLEYKGKSYTKHFGLKNLKLNQTDYENLIGLTEYADLKNLKDFYTVSWTDDQTGTLKVIYQDGDIKEIKDYGLQGTIDLQAIYKKLFEINDNIK